MTPPATATATAHGITTATADATPTTAVTTAATVIITTGFMSGARPMLRPPKNRAWHLAFGPPARHWPLHHVIDDVRRNVEAKQGGDVRNGAVVGALELLALVPGQHHQAGVAGELGGEYGGHPSAYAFPPQPFAH